jgi:hypothetical protein
MRSFSLCNLSGSLWLSGVNGPKLLNHRATEDAQRKRFAPTRYREVVLTATLNICCAISGRLSVGSINDKLKRIGHSLSAFWDVKCRGQ